MNKTEINAKLQYVFEGLTISKEQKQMLGEIISTIIETAIEGVSKPEIKAATISTIGGIKQAATVNVLETTDEIATVISTVNTLINNLKESGVIATK